jgi:AcrR family transcriptional regulator
MPKPRSEDRRNAILSAAARVIAVQGLGAATATIAKEASVSNGSLFVYFDTKSALLNELYVALKAEMGAAAMEGLPTKAEPREQLRHMWTGWLRWASAAPAKRRALAQLDVSEEITADSHQAAHSALTGVAELLERSRADGPMREASLGFVLTLINAMADATIDMMLREPGEAEAHGALAFDAMWRVVAGPSPTTS